MPRLSRVMKRPAAAENALKRIRKWREICPDITLRSTFIVGFPGETDEDFEQLLDFIREAELDRVGCFQYSPVGGARANDLPDHVPADVMAERERAFMELQADISYERLQAKVGTVVDALVDASDQDGAIATESTGCHGKPRATVAFQLSVSFVGFFANADDRTIIRNLETIQILQFQVLVRIIVASHDK